MYVAVRISCNCFGLSYLPLFQCETSATEDMRDIGRMATQMRDFDYRLDRSVQSVRLE
jgi:hypothetical protein